MQFVTTFFVNYDARTKEEKELTLEDLANIVIETFGEFKENLPLIKLARFGDLRSKHRSLRFNENVLEITGVVGDYDGKKVTIEQAAELLHAAGIVSLVYTTPSHTDDAPKWRVVAPFSRALPPEAHYQMVARINGVLQGILAPESFVLSQSYYFGYVKNNPDHRAIIPGGNECVDTLDHLDETAIGKPNYTNGDHTPGEPQATIEDIQSALDIIPNPMHQWDLESPTWDHWNNIGMAIWRASAGSDEGLEAFRTWSAKWADVYNEDETNYRWKHFFECPPDKIGFGTLSYFAKSIDDKWLPPSQIRNRPIIQVVEGRRPDAVAAGIDALVYSPFYQRQSKIVFVARQPVKRSKGSVVYIPSIMPVAQPMLEIELCQRAIWQKWDNRMNRLKLINVPNNIADAIMVMVNDWKFQPITGVINTPTMRADGTLLLTPGYDEQTGYVLFEPPPMPSIPLRPTKDQALEAFNIINTELLSEFPFVNDASRSVAMSLIMSLVLRPALGVVPLHVVSAPEAGTGKSFIFDLASMISVGQTCPAISRGHTAEETEKRLIGAALDGRPLICLDNVNGQLSSEFLCQAIERPLISPRILGSSKMPPFDNSFVCGANGNNIEIADDLVRRTLRVMLDANVETPWLRTFSNAPLQVIDANRGRYIAAILIIARAYVIADRPKSDNWQPLASFDQWNELVRAPLIWLGCPDPITTMDELKDVDPIRDLRANVLAELHNAFSGGFTEATFTVPKIIEKVNEIKRELNTDISPLETAMLSIARDKTLPGRISVERLGWWLKKNHGRMANGYKLVRGEATRTWMVAKSNETTLRVVPASSDQPLPEPVRTSVNLDDMPF